MRLMTFDTHIEPSCIQDISKLPWTTYIATCNGLYLEKKRS